MYKIIIFDLDGTLLNTSEDIRAVLNNSLKKFGLPQLTYEQTLRFVGNGAKKLIERAIGGNSELFERVYNDYSVNFAACENNLTTPYAGCREFLTECNKRGIKLAIITNKPDDATAGVYKKWLSEFAFDRVIGQSDKFPLKPDAAATLSVINGLGFDKSECVFVGDGETDVQTAKNAGIKCVSALWGFRRREQLAAAGATLFAESYKELSEIIFH